MKKGRLIFNLIAVIVLTLAANSLAQAQNSRSWVSGIGDDVNPCSRTAPCKTFAGAISKTADGGEINALDPGGFGAVTITKSVTIDGGGMFASILTAGSNAITITDGNNTAVVTLRNIALNGATISNIGVRIISAKSVTIEGCQIFKYRGTAGSTSGRAISDERTAAGSKLTVINTTVNDNSAIGVVVTPGAGTSGVTAVLDNVRIFDNGGSGFFAGLGAKVTIKNSFITTNGNAGVQSADANTKVNIVDTVISNNVFGIFAGGGTSVTRITRCTITENGNGITLNSGGIVESFGDNNIRGNNAANAGVTGVGQL